MITIGDIARMAGVSKTTVSRVISNKTDVSEKTRQKVLDIIRKHNYHPSRIARMLGGGANAKDSSRKMNITLFCENFPLLRSNSFFADIIESIETDIRARDYDLIYCSTGSGETLIPRIISQNDTDGVIAIGLSKPMIQKIEKMLPVVMVDYFHPGTDVDAILADYEWGAYSAVKYLIELGHRRIGLITGSLAAPYGFGYEMYWGYNKALREASIELSDSLVKAGDLDVPSGYTLGKELLASENRPTAILTNDNGAIGVMKVAYELGIAIPDELSLIGCDDINVAQYLTPSLTTIGVRKREMGRAAVKRVFEKIAEPALSCEKQVIMTDLVIRQSCAPVKK